MGSSSTYSPKLKGRKMPYPPAYAADPEKGLPPSPSHIARRIFVPRKPKWVLGGIIIAAFILYYLAGPPAPPPRPGRGDGKGWGPGPWDDGAEESSSTSSTAPGKTSKWKDVVVDEHGNHFVRDWVQDIAPMHPDVSLLPKPSDIFPDLNVSYSELPYGTPFPEEDLRKITSDPPDLPAEPANTMPLDAWSQQWKAPQDWDNKKTEDIKRVQWEGFAGGRDRWESEKERKERVERKEAVKRGFRHAWEAYKAHAWGHDEVRPVSCTPSDPFNGWGATIIDSLDTLLLMGFSEEYNLCRPHINQLKFQWVNGRDWSQGFVSDEINNGEVWAVQRDKVTGLPVFETGIRYLGGLLGAYDLSGDQLLLDRGIELAEILSTAFKTGSGLPTGRMDPGTPDEMIRLGTVSLAEVGSMSLELIRLAQITQDRKWFDLAQRAMDYIHERVIPRTVHNPLIPMWFQPDGPVNQQIHGGLTFGGLADSYYEYLIKTYKLLSANEVSKVWKDVYERSIDKAKEVLYVDIDIVPDHDLLAVGKLESGRLIPELEHLTCFIGAMLGLGAKLLNRPGDMKDAERVTASCYWLSASTPTGLQPEVMEWFEPHQVGEMYENVTLNAERNHPLLYSSDDKKVRDGMHRDTSGVLRWNGDNDPVFYADRQDKESGPVEYAQRLKGTPAGAKKVSTRGLNRPETIESIFYMYRLTGDRKWQDKGWKMFTSWMNASTVDGGFSSLHDVTAKKIKFSDNMESFALAETFKYHFLLQSEPDVLSLDDYVLNTEAHPFLVNPKLDPTAHTSHTRMWTPPPNHQSEDYIASLGTRGSGTDVQKFARLEVLERMGSPFQGPPNAAGQGGRGMGGGGKPKPKPEPPKPPVMRFKPGEKPGGQKS
ncbi:mannosyl-oligosaccharide 1,2-alpha-mannosidase [Cryptococcus wingfieldii CBS 7118]|uniref:alpha-1,2-Mannosidase n=1 Tax=Cryptococcus wingfieldii CBS 7118 TaxID=1295528 RepID=A0A1E3IFY1_9TREE|nr:mannosyl-oligosaccharide 1,2-alpha-mannosidase [Cryptococcus wingfieldii CBS 7118]ODN87438.1 mannosyl-oligosaccharide 1,2-alpha-mannosidase [Cryptococcus wingfieldii CBS 7118]